MTALQEGSWHNEFITPDLVQSERVKEVFYSGKTKYQEVVVLDGACFGRSLVLDGKTQSTELDEFMYHEALVHPSMVAHEGPETVFVAGGGEGATIREVLSHKTVKKVVMVDIDREVVELCRKYLTNHHRGSFDDERLTLLHDDALAYLENTDERFDVAIIDVPDPLETGPAYLLFTQEFYRLLADRLTANGMMVAQSGPTGPSFYQQCFSAVANTVGSVFPRAFLYEAFIPSFGSTWGFVIGSLGPDPMSMTVDKIDERVASRVESELRFYDGVTQQGMFGVPKFLRQAVAQEKRVITEADPLFVV